MPEHDSTNGAASAPVPIRNKNRVTAANPFGKQAAVLVGCARRLVQEAANNVTIVTEDGCSPGTRSRAITLSALACDLLQRMDPNADVFIKSTVTK